VIWTPAEENKLIRAVTGAPSVAAAVDAARAALPQRSLNADAIGKKLSRLGQPSLTELVAKTAPTTESDLSGLRMQRKVSELEAANKRLLTDLSLREDEIKAMRAMGASKPLAPVVAPKRVGAMQRRGTAFGLFSDWHIEEVVDPKTVNGLNEYNPQIAERCIDRCAEAFAALTQDSKLFDVREAVIAFIGDLYSGHIHDELLENNAMAPVEAALWLLDRMEGMLRRIVAECPSLERVLVPCNDGNHGRLTHKIRVATRTKNSLEWMLYHVLARRMSDDKRFEFQIADGEWNYVSVYNATLAFTHGDSFKYQGGVGGLLIPVRRGMNEMRKYRKIDHVSMGHFHQRLDLQDISVNGSMIGINPYSMRIHASPEPRQQSWMMWDSERGKCLSAPIWL
jgi:hypothetical protein